VVQPVVVLKNALVVVGNLKKDAVAVITNGNL